MVNGMRKDTVKPDSVATRIAAFLAERPNEKFRCYQIADELGIPTQQTASECGRLWRNGRVARERVNEGGRLPVTYYQTA